MTDRRNPKRAFDPRNAGAVRLMARASALDALQQVAIAKAAALAQTYPPADPASPVYIGAIASHGDLRLCLSVCGQEYHLQEFYAGGWRLLAPFYCASRLRFHLSAILDTASPVIEAAAEMLPEYPHEYALAVIDRLSASMQ